MLKTPFAHTSATSGAAEPLAEHLKKTAEHCSEYLEPVNLMNAGNMLGLLHDLGKADELFQQVLRGERSRVNHAMAGAAYAKGLLHANMPVTAEIIATVIASHHGGLDGSLGKQAEKIFTSGLERDRENRDVALGNQKKLKEAAKWLNDALPGALRRPERLPVVNTENIYSSRISGMLLTRMLYSALVDADWTATASFDDENYLETHTGVSLDANASMERLLALRAEKQRGGLRRDGSVSPLNRLRDSLFDTCLTAGNGTSGLYTLTAPTGMGKTLALMAFALRQCQANRKRRIIVLLPWLSLAEQNTTEYRRVFPGPGELLEIHSAACAEGLDEDPEDEMLREKLRALSERWSAPCIVSTVVSFFEPLFSDQARACRHLHQIMDSVVILDEAQSLPHELLHATLLCVRELVERYRCTVLFSTATQPAFQKLPGMSELWQPTEIVPDPQIMADSVRRVRYDWRLQDRALSRETLRDALLAEHQALLIVNTRAAAQRVYGELRAVRADEVLLLSADLCLAHRQIVLNEARQRLSEGKPCLLVSTSCVEAGVDISFPALYRQLAPLESIIQAAGRCNRNGFAPDGRVTVFEYENSLDNTYPADNGHYERCAVCVKELWMEIPALDPYDLSLIGTYDARIYRDKSDKRALTEAVCSNDFGATRCAYQMIGEYGVNLIVPYDRQAFARLRSMADAEGLTPALIRLARPYSINVPFKLVENVACPIPVKGRDGTCAAGWYLLGNPDRYDISEGFGFRRVIEASESSALLFV